MEIGAIIRRLRLLRGHKQSDLAEHLSMSGPGYTKIEQGTTDIPFSRLLQIADFFEMTPAELLSYELAPDGLRRTTVSTHREAELENEVKNLSQELNRCQDSLRDKDRIISLLEKGRTR